MSNDDEDGDNSGDDSNRRNSNCDPGPAAAQAARWRGVRRCGCGFRRLGHWADANRAGWHRDRTRRKEQPSVAATVRMLAVQSPTRTADSLGRCRGGRHRRKCVSNSPHADRSRRTARNLTSGYYLRMYADNSQSDGPMTLRHERPTPDESSAHPIRGCEQQSRHSTSPRAPARFTRDGQGDLRPALTRCCRQC